MNYLKFLATTLVALLVLGFGIYSSGPGFGVLVMIGAIGGYILMRRPLIEAIAFPLWLICLGFWHGTVRDAVHANQLAMPDKYTPDHTAIVTGTGILIGMIIFHPISYGAAKLTLFLWHKSLRLRKTASVESGLAGEKND